MPDELIYRVGPQAREPSKSLMGGVMEKDFWSPATRGLKKDSDRFITPSAEAVRVPAHLALPGSLQTKQLHYLHGQLSLGQSCNKQKKSCACEQRVASRVLLCQMSESPSGKREGLQDNATHKKGSLLLTRVRAPAISNAVMRGQRAPSPSCYTNL